MNPLDDIFEKIQAKTIEIDEELFRSFAHMDARQRRYAVKQSLKISTDANEIKLYMLDECVPYSIQKKYGIDLGFCKHFDPRYELMILKVKFYTKSESLHRCKALDISPKCKGIASRCDLYDIKDITRQ